MKKFSVACGMLVVMMVLCFPVLSGNSSAIAGPSTATVATLPTLLGYGATDSLPLLATLPQLMGNTDPFAMSASAVPYAPSESRPKTGCGCCTDCKCANCGYQQMPQGKVQYQQVCGPNGCRYVPVNKAYSGSNVNFGYGGGEENYSSAESGRRRLFNGNGPIRRIFSRCRR